MNPAQALRPLLLTKPRLTLAVAESLTCGQVQAQIGAVSGASDYFLGGVTAYTVRQKIKLLGVNAAHARRVNGVSPRVAVEMACGVAELFGADLGLATTGYAEKNPAAGAASPMAWWAICQRRRGGRWQMISGQIVLDQTIKRVAAQEFIARTLLGELVAHLDKRDGHASR